MDAIVEEKVRMYLTNRLHYNPVDCGTIVSKMRALATAGGFDLHESFRFAGMTGGPEARIAAGIVDLALCGGGAETPEYAIRSHIRDWLIKNPVKGYV